MIAFNKNTILLNEGIAAMPAARQPETQVTSAADEVPRCRRDLVIDTARTAGLLGGENGRIAGRVREVLIRTAKARSGIASDTELLEYALAKIAIEDDFGPRILARKGKVSGDLDLEF